MKKMTGFVFLLLFAGGLSGMLRAQGSTDVVIDDAKMTQIKRLIVASSLEDLIVDKFKEGITEGMEQMQGEGSGMQEAFVQRLMERFVESFDPADFSDQVIAPVLASHFTTDELTILADFMETDLGKRLVASKLSGEGDAEGDDFDKMLAAGEISEEDGAKMMQLVIRLGKKKALLEDGTLSDDIQTRAMEYGQNLMMQVMSDMMEEGMEEGPVEVTE